MDVQPLLFITSPSFFLEVLEEVEHAKNEESTSIFIPTPQLQQVSSLVIKQLNFFAKPMKEPRMLLFLMNDGERIYASINRIQNEEVLLDCHHDKRWIQVNDIAMIQRTI